MKRYLYAGYATNEITGKSEFRCSNRPEYAAILTKEGKTDVDIYPMPGNGLPRAEARKLVDQVIAAGFKTAQELLAHRSRPVERVNLVTGETYIEAADTPLSCSPAS
jgi:hypothetical protein